MYTSGSTGVPKGVILSHCNVISAMKAFSDAVQVHEDDILIGFLPLAHVFELLAESVCLLTGVPIGYSTPLTMIDSSSKIKKGTKGDATVLHPTCMTAVPVRVYKKFLPVYQLLVLINNLHTKRFLLKNIYDFVNFAPCSSKIRL